MWEKSSFGVTRRNLHSLKLWRSDWSSSLRRERQDWISRNQSRSWFSHLNNRRRNLVKSSSYPTWFYSFELRSTMGCILPLRHASKDKRMPPAIRLIALLANWPGLDYPLRLDRSMFVRCPMMILSTEEAIHSTRSSVRLGRVLMLEREENDLRIVRRRSMMSRLPVDKQAWAPNRSINQKRDKYSIMTYLSTKILSQRAKRTVIPLHQLKIGLIRRRGSDEQRLEGRCSVNPSTIASTYDAEDQTDTAIALFDEIDRFQVIDRYGQRRRLSRQGRYSPRFSVNQLVRKIEAAVG